MSALSVMSLIPMLADYDGKSVARLEEIHRAVEPTPKVFDELLALTAGPDENASIGATWLLRRWLRGGARPPVDFTARLAERLDDVTSPWARQHLCQCMADLGVGEDDVEAFGAFVRTCRASERPFLRAWAVDALVRLAASHPALEGEAHTSLEEALADPASSVRARARRIVAG